MTTAADHNKIAGQIVNHILTQTAATGGSTSDVLILTESIVVAIVLFCTRMGCADDVLDKMIAAAKRRIAEKRLLDAPPAGSA